MSALSEPECVRLSMLTAVAYGAVTLLGASSVFAQEAAPAAPAAAPTAEPPALGPTTLLPAADALPAGQIEEVRQGSGRTLEVRVAGADAPATRKAAVAAVEELARVLRKLDHRQRDSEWYAINQGADHEEVLVSEETANVLQRTLDFCKRTGSAYDPMVASWDYLWDFSRKPFVRPLPAEIAARKPIAACKNLLIKPGRVVRILTPGGRVTAQGIAAGTALQKAAELLRAAGITDFRLRVGNDVYAQGRIGTQFWYQTVPHPRQPGMGIGLAYLTSHAAATRTDAEQVAYKAGVRYHDGIDPRTGQPVSGVAQATVFSADPQQADALSNAVFVLGPKAGLTLLQGIANVEAVIVDSTGKVWTTPGIAAFARVPAKIAL